MNAQIEALVKKYASRYRWSGTGTTVKGMRAALTEQAETHAIELREYEATVANLNERIKDNDKARALSECAYKIQVSNLEGKIRQLESERVPDYTGGDAELLRKRLLEVAIATVPGYGIEWTAPHYGMQLPEGKHQLFAVVQQQKEGA